MNDFPSRAPSHILEEKSDRFLRGYLPVSWVINKPIDYGLDYYVEVAEDNAIKGINFSIQLKAHETFAEKGEVVITLKRSTINMYLNRLEPILLVCYIDREKEAFYDWFKDDTVDLTKDYTSYSVKLNKRNKITRINWATIVADIKKIFSRKFLLNALPEIDFSNIKDGDEKLAAAYYVKGHFEQAEQVYKRLLSREPRVTWLSALAMCQYSLYRYREALININKALEISDMLELWINKASILAEDGILSRDKAKLLEAKSIFQRAITTYDDAHYCYNYANTLNELGEYGLAETFYKKALKKNPNYAEAWKNLGEVYFRMHRHDKERMCYNNALKIKPDLPEAVMSLGIYLIRSKEDIKKGLNMMDKAVELVPDIFFRFQMAYFWFAFANFELGDEKNALIYLQKGLNVSPGNIYLLNLKREYLAKHWQTDADLEKEYIAFLEYRLSLDETDLDSFASLVNLHLTCNRIGIALHLVKVNTGLLSNVDEQFLIDREIPISNYLTALPYYREYAYFRQKHPSERYGLCEDHDEILSIIELISFGMYEKAYRFCKSNREIKNKETVFADSIVSYAAEHFAICARLFITASNEDFEAIKKEMAFALAIVTEIAMREAGLIIGHVGHYFKLHLKKLNAALSEKREKKNFGDLLMNCINEIQNKHHVFPTGE
jgi:tetratricopeptide (TPR) repeat protein